jgi:phospholipase/carboxylesterase
VLISNGRVDPIVPLAETERLASLLRAAGAGVEVLLQPAGHQLTQADLAAAQAWLRGESVMSS